MMIMMMMMNDYRKYNDEKYIYKVVKRNEKKSIPIR